MKINWVRHLVIKPTLGLWQHKNRGVSPQQSSINEFCANNHIQTHYVGQDVPTDRYEMVTLSFSKQQFVDIEHIDNHLLKSLIHCEKFLHLSVNKFLVYSETDRNEYTDTANFDERLINHWMSVVNKDVVFVEYNNDDRGQLGNWGYPITNIIWRVHE